MFNILRITAPLTKPKARCISLLCLIVLMIVFFPLCSYAEASEPETAAEEARDITPHWEKPDQITEEWFDDVLFVGDSFIGSLNIYNIRSGGLGTAEIVHVNGLACHNIIRKNQVIPYRGKAYAIEDLAAAAGKGKLYLLLAMNDLGYSDEMLGECWRTMLERIQTRCPELEIFIQSGTPVPSDLNYFTRENMNAYNRLLRTICEECGCIYVDICNGMIDEDGFLKKEYRLDYIHLDQEGCAVWVENLYNIDRYIFPKQEISS